jgi:hypothetical protein
MAIIDKKDIVRPIKEGRWEASGVCGCSHAIFSLVSLAWSKMPYRHPGVMFESGIEFGDLAVRHSLHDINASSPRRLNSRSTSFIDC